MNVIDDRETKVTRAKYNRTARFYNVLEFPMELFWYSRWRKRLFDKVKSKCFLELGVGTGKNLRYYPANSGVVAVDLTEGMLVRAAGRSDRGELALIQADAQRLPFRNAKFETVVATFVFCSVPDPVLGFEEIRRVLRQDGCLVLLEHVLPENTFLARLFRFLNPLVVRLTGVHINRPTCANLRKAGFVLFEESNLLLRVFKLFVAKPEWREDHAASTMSIRQYRKEP